MYESNKYNVKGEKGTNEYDSMILSIQQFENMPHNATQCSGLQALVVNL